MTRSASSIAPPHTVLTATTEGRVDHIVLSAYPDACRRQLSRMFAEGLVKIGGRRVKKGTRIIAGAHIHVTGVVPTSTTLAPTPNKAAPLVVLYQDPCVVVANKVAATPSHPLRADETDTHANALVARYPECLDVGDDPRESGLVHRLDTDTTGVLVAARDDTSWRRLRAALSAGDVRKHYLALVAAQVDAAGSANKPIGTLAAHSTWTVARSLGNVTLLRVTAHTGRMHQIRIHLAEANMPIIGDVRYGGPNASHGCFLHAARFDAPHPNGGRLTVDAPLPPDRAAIIEQHAAS